MFIDDAYECGLCTPYAGIIHRQKSVMEEVAPDSSIDEGESAPPSASNQSTIAQALQAGFFDDFSTENDSEAATNEEGELHPASSEPVGVTDDPPVEGESSPAMALKAYQEMKAKAQAAFNLAGSVSRQGDRYSDDSMNQHRRHKSVLGGTESVAANIQQTIEQIETAGARNKIKKMCANLVNVAVDKRDAISLLYSIINYAAGQKHVSKPLKLRGIPTEQVDRIWWTPQCRAVLEACKFRRDESTPNYIDSLGSDEKHSTLTLGTGGALEAATARDAINRLIAEFESDTRSQRSQKSAKSARSYASDAVDPMSIQISSRVEEKEEEVLSAEQLLAEKQKAAKETLARRSKTSKMHDDNTTAEQMLDEKKKKKAEADLVRRGRILKMNGAKAGSQRSNVTTMSSKIHFENEQMLDWAPAKVQVGPGMPRVDILINRSSYFCSRFRTASVNLSEMTWSPCGKTQAIVGNGRTSPLVESLP